MNVAPYWASVLHFHLFARRAPPSSFIPMPFKYWHHSTLFKKARPTIQSSTYPTLLSISPPIPAYQCRRCLSPSFQHNFIRLGTQVLLFDQRHFRPRLPPRTPLKLPLDGTALPSCNRRRAHHGHAATPHSEGALSCRAHTSTAT